VNETKNRKVKNLESISIDILEQHILNSKIQQIDYHLTRGNTPKQNKVIKRDRQILVILTQ
jgi:hypothetical protein